MSQASGSAARKDTRRVICPGQCQSDSYPVPRYLGTAIQVPFRRGHAPSQLTLQYCVRDPASSGLNPVGQAFTCPQIAPGITHEVVWT